jgi:hypothetical protein
VRQLVNTRNFDSFKMLYGMYVINCMVFSSHLKFAFVVYIRTCCLRNIEDRLNIRQEHGHLFTLQRAFF